MKRIYALLFLLIPCALFAAETYYNFPDATSLPDDSRILMRDGSTNKNITGLKLKQEIAAFANMSTTINLANTTEALDLLNGPSDTPLVKIPGPSAGTYTRTFEIKDSSGNIKMYANAAGTIVIAGQLVLGGVPVALAVTDVFPDNAATSVATSSVPYIDFNKGLTPSISTVYIVGNATAPVYASVCISGCGEGETPVNRLRVSIPATLAAGTTYTIRVVKNSILQTDGETASSCGTAMTDNAGVCESTFTTAP